MAVQRVFDAIEILLGGAVIAVIFMVGVLYFYRGKQKDLFNEKIIMFGFACLFFGLAFMWIFIHLANFQHRGTYISHTFYADLDHPTSNYEFFRKGIYISFGLGVAMFLLAFEIYEKHTKYILTTIQSILIILIILSTSVLLQQLIYIIFMYSFISLVLILYYFTKWSSFEFKAVSSLLLFGIVIFAIGMGLLDINISALNIVPYYFSLILYIIGSIIAISPTLINPKYFSKALNYWKGVGILTIGIICYFEIYFIYYSIYYEFPVYLSILLLVFVFVLIFILYRTINIIKHETTIESREVRKDEKMINVLGVFAKHQKVTEEEVTFHKEMKICLICKGKISRLSYICPGCYALYCVKCSEGMVNLENACWVCNEPFDESKPSTPFKIKEDIREDVSKV
jgi:hypothetical protein